MPDVTLEQIQAELEKLKSELADTRQERDALKAAAGEAPPDTEGLKKNRDAILDEKKQVEKENKALAAKLAAYEKEKETNQKKSLEEQNKYKELWELEKANIEKVQAQMVESQKKSAFKDILISAGLNPKFVKFALNDISQIQFDESHNPVNADTFVESYKQEYPSFFNSKISTPPKTDSVQPSLTGTQQQPITTEWINQQKNKIPNMTKEEYKQFQDKIETARLAGQLE